ncbi:ribonuclease P protein component [Aquimarina sp. EL_43]|uniref:ribonuclease P protein component n=1 Tax=unclassified Aquimarina TaxID=2627091 RepID=UPI0018C8DC97|nr:MULTISPECIES: ribonuclease P protein component [unclassified Aquimarina]MBG6133082.1 ribonuclease P protein component [Aquimarina sp. EL_35]MBG6153240.1 ribonuclease P protein component [Aquimarina sp. EL_32]MBG6171491.1 ribonuclease P protein component [Aquimarina sp. EL_43]
MKATFNKKERLKSKKEIELLFSEGKSISKYPIRLVYRKSNFDESIKIRAGVSVSKRNFKKAVDRNCIKRLMRESYRKNKYIVPNTTHQFTFMFLFSGKEMPEYSLIESKIKGILQKFVEQEIKSK